MRLTKLEHAALVLEQSGKKLFIDPGSFTVPITEGAGAVAIVVTHEHADHWTPEQLKRILDASPGIPIYGPQGFADAAEGFDVTVVHGGDSHEVGPFSLRFFGDRHAEIHSSIPIIDNVGVLVNDILYYAGDAYTVPPIEVDVLAVPAGAPWMRIADSIDYVLEVKPKRAFTLHEMVLSQAGKTLSNDRIRWATEQTGGEFWALAPGESIDL